MSASPFANRPAWRERQKILLLCGSYQRADALVDMAHDGGLPSEIWLRLVRDEWSCIDGIRDHLTDVIRFEAECTNNALHHLMTPAARRRLAVLPDRIAAYRGCFEDVNDHGVSYSLNRDTAVKFPTVARYVVEGGTPVLLTADLNRNQCFLVDDRGEEEIVDLWATPDDAVVEYMVEALPA